MQPPRGRGGRAQRDPCTGQKQLQELLERTQRMLASCSSLPQARKTRTPKEASVSDSREIPKWQEPRKELCHKPNVGWGEVDEGAGKADGWATLGVLRSSPRGLPACPCQPATGAKGSSSLSLHSLRQKTIPCNPRKLTVNFIRHS